MVTLKTLDVSMCQKPGQVRAAWTSSYWWTSSPPRTVLGLTVYPSPQKVMSGGATQVSVRKKKTNSTESLSSHLRDSFLILCPFLTASPPPPTHTPCKKPQALWSILHQLALLHVCGQVRPCPPLPLAPNTSYLPDFSVFNLHLGFPGGSVVKNPPARDVSSIPGLGRSPEEENSNPLQYSYLKNPMDRGGWRATVHRVAKSRTELSN